MKHMGNNNNNMKRRNNNSKNNKQPSKSIRAHVTYMTNTKNIKKKQKRNAHTH